MNPEPAVPDGPRRRVVLAIDPGRLRCGMAVCEPGAIRARAIVLPAEVPSQVRRWHATFAVTEIVVGNRTGFEEITQAVARAVDVPVRSVSEEGSTLRARARYFADNPPRGWRRLVPRSLQTPPQPYDDYVAVLLAEAALSRPPG